jgi:hypothetical protein
VRVVVFVARAKKTTRRHDAEMRCASRTRRRRRLDDAFVDRSTTTTTRLSLSRETRRRARDGRRGSEHDVDIAHGGGTSRETGERDETHRTREKRGRGGRRAREDERVVDGECDDDERDDDERE